ncbi:MAG: hypothetical protein SF066_22280 [Thermoanaerobaculia bacterium]|nr:hypothetical protein [Thermoanaerobaculia bacterium]
MLASVAGNLEGGATAWGSTTALVAFGLLAASAREWADPWHLGRGCGWLPWGLMAWVAVALSASGVPRAGLVGLAVLPAFVLAPGVFARWLASEKRRRWELVGLSAVVFVVAAWSMAAFVLEVSPRPARPLGHHNLLATFLVTLLPVALLPLRQPGWGRWLAGAAGLAAGAAVVASKSLSGGLALGVVGLSWVAAGSAGYLEGVHFSRGSGRPSGRPKALRRAWIAIAGGLVVVLGAVVLGPRIGAILGGDDLSALARRAYAEAGFRGIAAAPVLGHGPGSTPWTIAEFLRPVPGVTPPGEILGELHAWPLAVAYELGLGGLGFAVLALVGFGLRRVREIRRGGDSWPLGVAGLTGLAAAVVAGLGTAEWRVTALPLALAVTMGVALAGGRPREAAPTTRWQVVRSVVLLTVLTLFLLPKQRAHFLYERAVPTGDLVALAEAHRLDPDFPLYGARLAWARADAEGARAAAVAGGAVASLWAGAADLGVTQGAAWGREAALWTAALDPLLPVGPWLALTSAPAAPDAPRLAAHALAADPRLGGAFFWQERPELLASAVAVLEADPGIDPGWRQVAVQELVMGPRVGEPGARLGLGFDDDPARSVALVVFRRRPWAVLLAPVRVGAETAGRLSARLPSAARFATSSSQVLVRPQRAGGGPQGLWKTLRKTP